MKKPLILETRVARRIARTQANVFLRDDFKDLGDYDQVGRVLRKLAAKGKQLEDVSREEMDDIAHSVGLSPNRPPQN